MQEQPYSRQEPIDFDSEFIKVLCLASQETVKGLQWALDRLNFSDRKYKLFLGNLQSMADHHDADMVILLLDISQPVPLESLKKINRKPGLALFIQPTPQQLLQLNELPLWQSMAWDGASYDRLALRLDEVGARFEEEIRRYRFVESGKKFLMRDQFQADFVEWLNPPDSYHGMTIFVLDVLRGTLTVGGAESQADLKIPLDQSNRSELGEFRYINGKWSFKPSLEGAPILLRGNRENLKAGDQIEIQRHLIQVKRSLKVDELMRLSKRLHILEDQDLLRADSLQGDASKTIGDLCRELLISGVTGELRLNAGVKSGSVFFNEGVLYHSVTGCVNGVKALTRMFSWQDPHWKINLKKISDPERCHFRITLKEFSRVYDSWKVQWQKISPYVPPLSVRLRANSQRYLQRQEFSLKEAKVLAAICEYPLVRDVMNSCGDMVDVEIAQTLIVLRKQGLIELMKA